jgi:hypothetical protein
MDRVFMVGAYGLLVIAFNTFDVQLHPGLLDGEFDAVPRTAGGHATAPGHRRPGADGPCRCGSVRP